MTRSQNVELEVIPLLL